MHRVFSDFASSPPSYASAKVPSSSLSISSQWSDHSLVDALPTYTQQPPHPNPWAPTMSPSILPHSGGSGSSHPTSRRSLPSPTDPARWSWSLHPILESGRPGRFMFDITQSLQNIKFRQGVAVNPGEPAVWPLTAQLNINVPGHPSWTFQVVNPSGVTLHDVLSHIFQDLQRLVSQQEFMSFAVQLQNTASTAFHARTSGNVVEHRLGVKRVDFLGPKTYFIGLSRTNDGSDAWDARFATTAVRPC